MKHETINKAKVTRLRNKLRRDIADSKWSLRGTEFCRFDWQGLGAEYKFACWFYCNLKRVRVHIYGDDAFDLPDADATFKGENAWDRCIEWTTDKLIEMSNKAAEQKEKYTKETIIKYYQKVFKGE